MSGASCSIEKHFVIPRIDTGLLGPTVSYLFLHVFTLFHASIRRQTFHRHMLMWLTPPIIVSWDCRVFQFDYIRFIGLIIYLIEDKLIYYYNFIKYWQCLKVNFFTSVNSITHNDTDATELHISVKFFSKNASGVIYNTKQQPQQKETYKQELPRTAP